MDVFSRFQSKIANISYSTIANTSFYVSGPFILIDFLLLKGVFGREKPQTFQPCTCHDPVQNTQLHKGLCHMGQRGLPVPS